jgi:hypothetical protein
MEIRERVTPTISSSSPNVRSICNICNLSDAFVFITRLDCNHLICTDCLKKYLDYKIKHDLLKQKGIQCCLCDSIISDDIIKQVLDQGTYNQYIHKISSRFNMTVKCPNKHRTVAHKKNNICDFCNANFCIVCKNYPHNGICVKTDLRNYFGFSFKNVCPECNKRFSKASKSVEKYVICKNPDCSTTFCKFCFQRYSPILAHGPAYHKYDCKLYGYSDYEAIYKPLECEECKKLGVLCPRPS